MTPHDMKRRRLTGRIAFGTALLVASTWASALPVTLDVGAGSQGGFSWSWLHAASNCSNGFCMNGAKDQLSPGGVINGDLTGGLLTLQSGSMAIVDDNSLLLAGATTLQITGGKLRGDFKADGTLGGNLGAGFIGYDILDGQGGSLNSGTFFFFPRNFVSGANPFPNSIDLELPPEQADAIDDFALWGNNWLNTANGGTSVWTNVLGTLGEDATTWLTGFGANSESNAAGLIGNTFGIDVRGPGAVESSQIVPEPATLGLLTLAMLGIGAGRRRPRRS